uniref:Peptide deformylase n=1 Tax=Thermodesulfovibrio aggregans TaxID=86166 RepID=A0A7C4AKF3_9BACT
MAILEIKKYPDEVLKKRADHVRSISGNLRKLIDDMIETMYNARGIGLAAPQVGVLKRIIVLDTNLTENQRSPVVLINPEIVSSEGEIVSEEGCLSIPGFITKVKRKEKVFVKALDRNGKQIEIEGTGLLARALQHEIDHLDGILIIDIISPLKRELFRRKYLKKKK